ncbi:uncharacterized protein ACB058_016925 isoform 2-T2 [Synchiropus picturatus]
MSIQREYFWLFLILGMLLACAAVSFVFFLINRCISRAVSGKHKVHQTSKRSVINKDQDKNLASVAYSFPIRTNHTTHTNHEIQDECYQNCAENIPDDHDYEENDSDVHDYEENFDVRNNDVSFPAAHDKKEGNPDDHDYEENIPDDHDYEENIPDDHDYEENIPDDHDYEENIPDDHDYEENIPDDHDYEVNIPDDYKPNKQDFFSFHPTHIHSTHRQDYKPNLASYFHAQQSESEQQDYVEVVMEESTPSLTYEAPDPADDVNSQDDYDDIDCDEDYDDLG